MVLEIFGNSLRCIITWFYPAIDLTNPDSSGIIDRIVEKVLAYILFEELLIYIGAGLSDKLAQERI